MEQKSSGEREQLGFGLEDTRPDPTRIDPDAVRAELHGLLSTARAANGASPWDARTLSYYRLVFPQMTGWLPTGEADRLRRDFFAAIARFSDGAHLSAA